MACILALDGIIGLIEEGVMVIDDSVTVVDDGVVKVGRPERFVYWDCARVRIS